MGNEKVSSVTGQPIIQWTQEEKAARRQAVLERQGKKFGMFDNVSQVEQPKGFTEGNLRMNRKFHSARCYAFIVRHAAAFYPPDTGNSGNKRSIKPTVSYGNKQSCLNYNNHKFNDIFSQSASPIQTY